MCVFEFMETKITRKMDSFSHRNRCEKLFLCKSSNFDAREAEGDGRIVGNEILGRVGEADDELVVTLADGIGNRQKIRVGTHNAAADAVHEDLRHTPDDAQPKQSGTTVKVEAVLDHAPVVRHALRGQIAEVERLRCEESDTINREVPLQMECEYSNAWQQLSKQ